MPEAGPIDALIARFHEVQELSRREIENLTEARQQELIVSLRDIPTALHIGETRNALQRWNWDREKNQELTTFIQTRGSAGFYNLENLIRVLDLVLQWIYEREKVATR